MLVSLPEEIWARVFCLLPFRERLCTVPLVCKSWDHTASIHGSVVWQDCYIDHSSYSLQKHPPHDYFKVVRWFGRRGRFIKSLSIMTPINEDGTKGKGWQFFRNGLAALLAHTPHLQTLECYDLSSFFVPEESLYILKQLPSLQSLCLGMRSNGNWQLATLDVLSHLTCLHSLSISVSNMRFDQLLLAPGLSQLTGLTSLTLRRGITSFADAPAMDEAISVPNLVRVVTRLTRLESLYLTGVTDRIPDSFTSLNLLRSLVVRGFDRDGPPFSISPAFVACSPLQSLSLTDLSSASAQALPLICSSICQLKSLRRLEIRSTHLSHIDAAACSFSPRLTELELSCGLSVLPPCILPMTNLESLMFHQDSGIGHGVPPIGPYLQNLKELRLWAVPANVSNHFLLAAENLEDLVLMSDDEEDKVPAEEIDRILAHTPAACDVAINHEYWFGS